MNMNVDTMACYASYLSAFAGNEGKYVMMPETYEECPMKDQGKILVDAIINEKYVTYSGIGYAKSISANLIANFMVRNLNYCRVTDNNGVVWVSSESVHHIGSTIKYVHMIYCSQFVPSNSIFGQQDLVLPISTLK